MNELVYQARLTHPCFADDRHHLTATAAGKLLGPAEFLQLDVAADEARQTSSQGGLEASSSTLFARGHGVHALRCSHPLERALPETYYGELPARQNGPGLSAASGQLRSDSKSQDHCAAVLAEGVR
jgi:hypothetical protein